MNVYKICMDKLVDLQSEILIIIRFANKSSNIIIESKTFPLRHYLKSLKYLFYRLWMHIDNILSCSIEIIVKYVMLWVYRVLNMQ